VVLCGALETGGPHGGTGPGWASGALERHGSIAAAAKALRVPRSRLMADAVRLGLRPPVATIPGDIEARYRQLGSLDAAAVAYEVDPTTAGRWLRALGVELRPPKATRHLGRGGRRPGALPSSWWALCVPVPVMPWAYTDRDGVRVVLGGR